MVVLLLLGPCFPCVGGQGGTHHPQVQSWAGRRSSTRWSWRAAEQRVLQP